MKRNDARVRATEGSPAADAARREPVEEAEGRGGGEEASRNAWEAGRRDGAGMGGAARGGGTAGRGGAEGSSAVRIRGLSVSAVKRPILDDACLDLGCGERVALLGESGSGKTTLSLALLGRIAPGLCLEGGDVAVAGLPVIRDGRPVGRKGLMEVRRSVGRLCQDPVSALTPTRRIGRLVGELAENCGVEVDEEARAHVLELFGLPVDRRFLRRFPAEVSGGQRRRIALARVLLARPGILVLDEPTAGLDEAARQAVVEHVDLLATELRASLIVITHDPGIAARLADRTLVMRDGAPHPVSAPAPAQVGACGGSERRGGEDADGGRQGHDNGRENAAPREDAPTHAGYASMSGSPAAQDAPTHDAGESRVARVPPLMQEPTCRTGREIERWPAEPDARESGSAHTAPASLPDAREQGAERFPLLEVRDLTAAAPGLAAPPVSGLSFRLRRGEALALTGPSGSGKSTVARTLVGLWERRAGQVLLDGVPMPALLADVPKESRGAFAWVPQDPATSVNPAMTLGRSLRRAAARANAKRLAPGGRRSVEGPGEKAADLGGEATTEFDVEAAAGLGAEGKAPGLGARECARLVGLPDGWENRYPSQLSGGQLQRFALARALAGGARVLILDEVTANLDSAARDGICELLRTLKPRVAMLVITHDPVVGRLCDREIPLG